MAAAARTQPERFVERDLGDPLGLRARDEDAPVDEQVEAEEVPPPEHVLQRLASGAALEHVVEMLDRGRGRGLLLPHHELDAVVARDPLDHPPRLVRG